jgi:protein-S-isoprenylcysteine O-methyltransferase Ste14
MTFLEKKIPPPIVTLIIGLLMWLSRDLFPSIHLPAIIEYALIFILLLLALIFLTASSFAFFSAKTTVNPLKPESSTTLITSGVYKLTRNPMYVGFALLLLAWTIFLHSLWSLGFIALYMAYIHRFQITPEEKALEKIFKEEFIAYKSQVRPWL